jgi:hypothetical protein
MPAQYSYVLRKRKELLDIERLPESLVNISAIGNPAHQLFHEIHLDLLNL